MNAVEIEQAISDLVEAAFDRDAFPFMFLEAFGNKATTITKLRKGTTNRSDVPGGILQRNNIHLLVCDEGEVGNALKALVESPETSKQKAKYALATDGKTIEAENLVEGETLTCEFAELADHFGFFLTLAGITTVKEIRNNAFDIKATSRLNRLYVELLKHNPDWDTSERREDMNHFFARLIFCFFAEDTGIFKGENSFTTTVEQMSDGTNAHEILTEMFRAMDIAQKERSDADVRPYATKFPYVNGGLFAGSPDVPKFTKIARSYLLHVGRLDWTQINPDIFGSMIQAVVDDEERGALGMHYTSVPNILKVLNPLFLDDLRNQLEEAGDNKRKLLNLRNRIARIRVFDPACGSGNFLVIAYKEMRAIEAEINERRKENGRLTAIPLTNFRGIELRSFPAEIARLALIIAEYQCDDLYRGNELALEEFLPLDSENWITCGNALRLDWLQICPPTGTGVKIASDDLFSTPLDQTEMDFENEGGETFICGNPPYLGSTWQSQEQKDDLKQIFESKTKSWKSLDYVSGWFMKAAGYGDDPSVSIAFVSTNSICQGQQAAILWPLIFESGHQILFAHTSFKWANLASHNAGVTVIVAGISTSNVSKKKLFITERDGTITQKDAQYIGAYLVPNAKALVQKISQPFNDLPQMTFGNKPVDGGNLLLSRQEVVDLNLTASQYQDFIRPLYGSDEFIKGKQRYCIWISDDLIHEANQIDSIRSRINCVKEMRLKSTKAPTRRAANWPHRFDERRQVGDESIIAVAAISSENRDYLPCGLMQRGTIISNKCYGLFDAPIWNLAVIASRLHWVWIATVCVRLKTDYSYSNTLGWNTFPIPALTDKNKADLTHTANGILLAREAHFPATIADLYDPEKMPANLRQAHEKNDETLERIYIGRRFKNDTERLEKLFEMYTKMTAKESK